MEKERIKNIGKTALDVGTDFIPGVSEAKDVAAITKGLKEGDYTTAGIHAAGLALGAVPVVGDIARRGLLTVTKAMRKDIDDAKKLMDNPKEKQIWKDENKVEQKQERVPEVQEAAAKLSEGKITSGEYRRIVKREQPIKPITQENFPELPTLKSIVGSLNDDKVAKGIVGVNKKIEDGTRVGSRLDIPAYEDYDTWVVSLHDGTVKGGKAIGYGQTAVLKNVEFMTAPKGGLNIAKGPDFGGTNKSTIARIHGDYYNANPEDVYEQAKRLINDPEWTQVGMNPFRHSYFYDKATGAPVLNADEVIQVGPLVLAKGVKTPSISELKSLKVKTSDKKMRMFNKGGDTMEQQMEMAFLKDEGATTDPVSGNDVPIGSMDQEVRDDIPAMLSEGEYVVPADVVRFHGVKLFEDLRDEAKIGMRRMEADGRIGGEPVEEQDGIYPFSLEELAAIDRELPPEDMAQGGIINAAEGTFAYTPNTRYGQGNRSNMGLELRTMVNPATGRTITIPFYNGRPMTVIPEGFVDKTVADEQALMQQQQNQQQQRDQRTYDRESPFDPDSPFNDRNRQQRPKPISEMSPAEIRAYNESMDSTLADVTSKLPIIVTLQRLNENSARRYATEALRSGKNPETNQALDMETKLALQQLLTLAENKSMLGAIADYVTGKGGQTTGVPLYEQANFEQMLTPIDPDPVVEPEIEKQMTDLEIEPSFVAGMKAVPEGGAKVVPAEPDTSFLDNVKNFFVSPVAASTLSDDQFSVEPSVTQKGIRNNPGNIKVNSKYRFAGQTDLTYDEGVVGEGYKFIVFSEPQFGFRALAMDARTKASPERHNGNIESMFLEYLGGGPAKSNLSLQERYEQAALDNPSDNPANPLEKVQNYIRNIQNAIGSETVDVNNINQMEALVKQIVINENTKETAEYYLSQPDVIREGIVLASKGVDALNVDGSLKTLDQIRMEFQPELEAAGLIQAPTTPATATQVASGLQGPDAAINQIPQAQTPVGIQEPSQIPVVDAQTPVGKQEPREIKEE